MTTEDMKITSLNAVTMAIANMPFEQVLKIILLIVSIVYTAQRIYINKKNNEKDK